MDTIYVLSIIEEDGIATPKYASHSTKRLTEKAEKYWDDERIHPYRIHKVIIL